MHNSVMKIILKSFAVIFAIGLSCAYFTSERVEASQQMLQVEKGLFEEVLEDNRQLKERMNSLTNVNIKLYYRLERLEAKNKMQIPQELEITIGKPK